MLAQTSVMEGDAIEAQQTPEPAKKAETEEVEKPKPQAAKTATTEEAVDEIVEEKKAKTDIVEEPTRGTRDEIEEVTSKEQEKPKTAEVEGKWLFIEENRATLNRQGLRLNSDIF